MNNFRYKLNCTVDSEDYMMLESSYISPVGVKASSSVMYFTNVNPNKDLDDTLKDKDEVCIGLKRKQIKKLRKFLKEWLDETRPMD